ncbi:MAG: hypothetical protein CFE26_10315 [Verrucomicrobiales bacterium VVV1]|nr:MAG: hypothetical protein CFE26_10315 [Verrucomicrobiales bacterium VVV1]
MIFPTRISTHAAAALITGAAAFAAEVKPFHVDSAAGELLDRYCYSCHDEETQKGDIRLDNLSSLSLEHRLDLMNKMQEQVYLGQMPPKKKTQPSEAERKELGSWLWSELNAYKASKLED